MTTNAMEFIYCVGRPFSEDDGQWRRDLRVPLPAVETLDVENRTYVVEGQFRYVVQAFDEARRLGPPRRPMCRGAK